MLRKMPEWNRRFNNNELGGKGWGWGKPNLVGNWKVISIFGVVCVARAKCASAANDELQSEEDTAPL